MNMIKNWYLSRPYVCNGFLSEFSEAISVYNPSFNRYLGRTPSNNVVSQSKLISFAMQTIASKVVNLNINDVSYAPSNNVRLVFGEGEGYKSLFEKIKQKNNGAKFIGYASGMPPDVQLENTNRRGREFEATYGIRALDRHLRIPDHSQHIYPLVNSDCLAVIGSGSLAAEFSLKYSKPAYNIWPVSQNVSNLEWVKKNFQYDKENVFIYFGSVGHVHKGVDIVLELSKIYKNYKFLFYGIFTLDDVQFFKKIIGYGDNVEFVGFKKIDSKRLIQDAMRARAVIFPTVSEGCSTGLVNMLANFGTPIVSVLECGLPRDYISSLATGNSLEEFSKGIEELLNVSNMNDLVGRLEVIKSTREFFSDIKFINKIIEIFWSVT